MKNAKPNKTELTNSCVSILKRNSKKNGTMNKKERIFLSATSVKQSKKLLEAGYSADMADMAWVKPNTFLTTYTLFEKEQTLNYPLESYEVVPAWSLLRLLQLLPSSLEVVMEAFVERYAQCKQAAMRAIELQAAGVGPGAGCAPAGEAVAPQQAAFGNAPSAASPYGTVAMPTAGFPGTFEGAAAPAGTMASSAGVRPGGSYAPASAQTGLAAPSATKAFAATASPYGTASGLGASGSSSASAANAQQPAAKGFLLPVVSGSGGAGKSAVALLAAHAAQGLGLRTLLLDFDLQFGDMAQLMGVKKPLRIDEVLARPERLGQLACEGKVPALLAAPEHVDAAEAVVTQAPALLDAVRERFDVIVANTGGAWAEQHAVLLERSSKALFLVDQRATSVHAAQRALDLCARCGIAVNPFLFTLNGCGKGAPLSSMDVSCALKGAHVHELPDGGADVEELLAAGLVVDLIDSRNDLFEGIE